MNELEKILAERIGELVLALARCEAVVREQAAEIERLKQDGATREIYSE